MNRHFYGYGTSLIVNQEGVLVGFCSTYPLREGERLVTQLWKHEMGDKIDVSPCPVDRGYFKEADVCTLGT